jgi:hypothetical protein
MMDDRTSATGVLASLFASSIVASFSDRFFGCMNSLKYTSFTIKFHLGKKATEYEGFSINTQLELPYESTSYAKRKLFPTIV